jgi:4-hydroxybenzoate polyprenyltransferase
MAVKIIAGIIGAVLLFGYVSPVVLRLKEVPLWCVFLLGAGMMLVDLWQSLTSKED